MIVRSWPTWKDECSSVEVYATLDRLNIARAPRGCSIYLRLSTWPRMFGLLESNIVPSNFNNVTRLQGAKKFR